MAKDNVIKNCSGTEESAATEHGKGSEQGITGVQSSTAEQNTSTDQTIPIKPRSGGSILERRFRLYDKIKISVKALDIIIAVAVIMLIVAFILGTYVR